MNEQPLDLRRSLDALRRRRVAIAIVGPSRALPGIAQRSGAPHPAHGRSCGADTWPAGKNREHGTHHSGAGVCCRHPRPAGPRYRITHSAGSPWPGRREGDGQRHILSIRAHAPQAQQAIALANGVAKNYIGWVKTHQSPGVGSASIIQPAAMARPASFFSRAFKNGGMGLFAGLLIAVMSSWCGPNVTIACAAGTRSPGPSGYRYWLPSNRLSTRPPPNGAASWSTSYLPQPARGTYARCCGYLVPGDLEDDLTICVAAFAEDRAALAAGPQLALAAAAFGLPADLKASTRSLRPAESGLRHPSEAGPTGARTSSWVPVTKTRGSGSGTPLIAG